MKMDRLLNKKVVKMTAGDLKKALQDADDDQEVVLSFMLYDEGRTSVYLSEAYTHMKYDPVMQEKLFDGKVVELLGFTDKMCTYMEKHDDK